MATLLASKPAFASPPTFPRFRVTDLRQIGAMSALNEGTAGINNKGQVVYAYESSSLRHAWFWLPETEYGFTGSAVYVIDSSSNGSIARDINEAGQICGFSATNREATVWTPNAGSFVSSSPVSPLLLGTDFSEGHAISNDSPPHVVGYRTLTEQCGSPAGNILEAFNWTATTSGSIASLAPISISGFNGDHSIAYDIVRTGSDYVVGLSQVCAREGQCAFVDFGTGWTPTPSPVDLDMGTIYSTGVFARYPVGYGINDAGKAVGWISVQETNMSITCKPRAVYWPSITSTSPVDLSTFIAYPNTNHLSHALAINSRSNQQAVGYDAQRDDALLWEHLSMWTCVELNSSANDIISACSDAEWHITEAHDINDNGWIVAVGDRASDGEHALLLTPVGCPWDVNEDGEINEDDAADVLAEIGFTGHPCPQAVICRWDVDFDCEVDRADYRLIFDYLLNCPYDPCPCEGAESMAATAGGGLSASRFSEALAKHSSLTSEQIAEA